MADLTCTSLSTNFLRSEMSEDSSFFIFGLEAFYSFSLTGYTSSVKLRKLLLEGIQVVNDSTLESLVLKADEPVLVDFFWAPLCGPCKMIDPIVNELAEQYTGKVKFYELYTDESPATPGRSIPTIMIFVNGEKKDTIIGAVPKTTLATSNR